MPCLPLRSPAPLLPSRPPPLSLLPSIHPSSLPSFLPPRTLTCPAPCSVLRRGGPPRDPFSTPNVTHAWSAGRLLERHRRPWPRPRRPGPACWWPAPLPQSCCLSVSTLFSVSILGKQGCLGSRVFCEGLTRPGSSRRDWLAGFWFCEGPALLQARLCAAHFSAQGRKRRRPGLAVGALGGRASPDVVSRRGGSAAGLALPSELQAVGPGWSAVSRQEPRQQHPALRGPPRGDRSPGRGIQGQGSGAFSLSHRAPLLLPNILWKF